jgi:hypothetical protein
LRFRRHLPLLALFLPVRLAAQAPADSAKALDPRASGDTLRAVELDRRDIFDPDERGWVARVGNALHVQTRAATIRREILFKSGEVFDSARVAESERNLRALGVFRRVRIDTVRTDSGLVARVLTKDGWSTKADWRFRSTGGQVAFTIGLVEDNLLGTASSGSSMAPPRRATRSHTASRWCARRRPGPSAPHPRAICGSACRARCGARISCRRAPPRRFPRP